MPAVRHAIEAFVSGALDYGALQAEFQAEAGHGTPRDVALHELRVVSEEIGLSQALNNLIARAIDRHFGGAGRPGSDTVPGGRADETAPGVPKRASAEPEPEPGPAAVDEPAPPDLADETRTVAQDEPPVAEVVPPDEREDPVDDLPPIFAGGDDEPAVEPPPSIVTPGIALPEPGAVLAERYVLQSVLGRGGMGVVYRALDRRRDEAGAANPFVALKVLRPELQARPAARERLFAEALRGQSLNHPNVVAVRDFDRDGELAFATMELLEGERLRTLIVRSAPGGLPQHEAFSILQGVLEAAGHLHAQGVVHRDLTPGNILVTNDGVPKLLDFGLTRGAAAPGAPKLHGADHAGHTPAYASPELLDGKPPDPRDDVYSLGILACELLTGTHPFGKLAADEAGRQNLSPKAPPGLSHAQWRTLRSALSFDADKRPPDAATLRRGLALVPPPRRTLRPGVVQGLLAGIAVGVLLTLAVIHPEGPIGRRLGEAPVAGPVESPPPAVPAVVEPEPTPQAEAAPVETPPPVAEPPAESTTTADGDILRPLPAPGTIERAPALVEPAEEAPAAVPAPQPAPAAAPEPGRLGFATAAFHINESTAVLIADIIRVDGTDGVVGVYWRTVASNALDGDDYVGQDWQRLELADGEIGTRIFVPLVNDGLPEVPESFFIELGRPDGGATIGPVVRAEVRIVDDDPPAGAR